jgi:pimeloyl-ACP methyl ester carboxylesterase
MIHGNGGSIAAFSQTIPYFEEKYMVIAVDSRAQGNSIDKNDSLTFEMMADDFSVLLDSLHIKKTYVIGWSDGGICALLLAIRHPDQVIKLASTGANLWPGYEPIRSSEWKSMQREYKKQLHRTWPTAKEKNDWKIAELDDFQPNIPLAALRKIKTPSLIICGDRDVIPVEHTVLISKNIPNAHLWVVPNSGHATLIEHSDEFNEKVDDFFSH